MHVWGRGQNNSSTVNDTVYLEEGIYELLIESEMPDDALVGVPLKMKVSLMIAEYYFMITEKYNEVLKISDPRVQTYYKQVYSSMALLKEDRIYLGVKGPNKSSIAAIDRADGHEHGDNPHSHRSRSCESHDPHYCSGSESEGGLGIVQKTQAEALKAKSQMFMVQHYSAEYNAFVQYVENNSTDQVINTTTCVRFKNMLQMGDCPEPSSRRLQANLDGDDPESSSAQNQILDAQILNISKYNNDVYKAVTSEELHFKLDHRVLPGQQCCLIFRQVHGGGLDKLPEFKSKCSHYFEIGKAQIKLLHSVVIDREAKKNLVN